jgi:hypothetical protein
MTKVYTGASMSLDGYVSGPAETGFEHLFKWYGNGEVEVPTAQPEMTLRMTPESAAHFRGLDLVPVLLGGGTPFFDQLKAAPVELEGPVSVVQGSDVTHLRYRVRHR